MPIRCLKNDEDIFSFNFDDLSWSILADDNKLLKNLRMSCCDSRAILKRSKLGTKFFAHSRRGECTSVPESAEHLLGKQLIAEAVQAAGWTARTEERGVSPDGETWIADVLAVDGNKKLAFEVQWSPQTLEETHRRQSIYKHSNIRGLWLMKQLEITVSRELPTFRLRLNVSGNDFDVLMPGEYSFLLLNNRNKDENEKWQQIVPIKKFIQGAILGKLKYAPAIGLGVPVEINAVSITCWSHRCQKSTSIVMSLIFKVSEVLRGHPDLYADIYNFDSQAGVSILSQLLPKDKLKEFKVGDVKQRYSKTVGGSYLSNGCFHCDALQGKFFDHEYYYDQEPIFRTQAVLDDNLVKMIEAEGLVYRWWFNEE